MSENYTHLLKKRIRDFAPISASTCTRVAIIHYLLNECSFEPVEQIKNITINVVLVLLMKDE